MSSFLSDIVTRSLLQYVQPPAAPIPPPVPLTRQERYHSWRTWYDTDGAWVYGTAPSDHAEMPVDYPGIETDALPSAPPRLVRQDGMVGNKSACSHKSILRDSEIMWSENEPGLEWSENEPGLELFEPEIPRGELGRQIAIPGLAADMQPPRLTRSN